MNYITFYLLLTLAIVIQAGQTIDEACQEHLGASDEDLLVYRHVEYPRTRMQMCLYDCIFQALGYSDGRRFKPDVFLHVEQEDVDEERAKALKEISENCDGIFNKDDSCVLAADIFTCLRGEYVKRKWYSYGGH